MFLPELRIGTFEPGNDIAEPRRPFDRSAQGERHRALDLARGQVPQSGHQRRFMHGDPGPIAQRTTIAAPPGRRGIGVGQDRPEQAGTLRIIGGEQENERGLIERASDRPPGLSRPRTFLNGSREWRELEHHGSALQVLRVELRLRVGIDPAQDVQALRLDIERPNGVERHPLQARLEGVIVDLDLEPKRARIGTRDLPEGGLEVSVVAHRFETGAAELGRDVLGSEVQALRG